MKKLILKLKIIMTNISRVIMSFLFINLNFSYVNRVLGENVTVISPTVTCYYSGPLEETSNTLTLKKVLIILVPAVIVIGTAILIIKKKKSKSKEEKKDAKKD